VIAYVLSFGCLLPYGIHGAIQTTAGMQ